jgi:hypothetical protein
LQKLVKKTEGILGVKLKFGGGNLFSPAMSSTIEGNNSMGSVLKPLLKKVTPIVGSRMLRRFAQQRRQQHKAQTAYNLQKSTA